MCKKIQMSLQFLDDDVWGIILSHTSSLDQCRLESVDKNTRGKIQDFRNATEKKLTPIVQSLPFQDQKLYLKWVYRPVLGWILECRIQHPECKRLNSQTKELSRGQQIHIHSFVELRWKKHQYLTVVQHTHKRHYTTIIRFELNLEKPVEITF